MVNGGDAFYRTGDSYALLAQYFAYKEQTEGGNPVLKKSFVVLLGAVLVLSACVPSQKIESLGKEAGTDVAASGPRGFTFESGFLEFGDFDPYALGDDIFNPCTEITLDEYAAAGFPGIEVEGDGATFHGHNACDIPPTEEQFARYVVTGFHNGRPNREMIEMQGLLLPQYTSELIPELFAFAAIDHDPSDCYTQIDTLRGGFGAAAGSLASDVTQDEMCELAIETTEQLFLKFGTGDVH